MTTTENDLNPTTDEGEVIDSQGDFWSARVHGTMHRFDTSPFPPDAPLVQITRRVAGGTRHGVVTSEGARTLAAHLLAAADEAEYREARRLTGDARVSE
jgi:hypothetical protein